MLDADTQVFICSPTHAVTFRKPSAKDTLGSALRERVFSGFEENEVAINDILKPEEGEEYGDLILRRGGPSTQKWDLDLANTVWESVRKRTSAQPTELMSVMPAHMWVTY